MSTLRQQSADKEMLAALNDESVVNPPSLAEMLDRDSQDLLLAAADADGYILHLRVMGGEIVQAGGKNMINPQNDPREQARWRSALSEIDQNGLVELVGHKGETFRVTKRGYAIADEIKASRAQAAAT